MENMTNSTTIASEKDADALLFSITAGAFLVLPLSIKLHRMLHKQFPHWSMFEKDSNRS
jgi:hypothetical protein